MSGGQRSMEDMPRLLCRSFTCIRGFLVLFYFFSFFYPPSPSGRLLTTHNDLEGAAKVLAAAVRGGSSAKARGRTVVSSHLQTIRLPLSGGAEQGTCAKHHVGKLSALQGTAPATHKRSCSASCERQAQARTVSVDLRLSEQLWQGR